MTRRSVDDIYPPYSTTPRWALRLAHFGGLIVTVASALVVVAVITTLALKVMS